MYIQKLGILLLHQTNKLKLKDMKTINQKIYAIVKKDTKEIVCFSLTPNASLKEWDTYFKGTDEELTHELQQTFMSQDDIKKEMNF